MLEPGLHPDIPFDAYAALPFINSGVINKAFLKRGGLSMKHMHAAAEGRLAGKDTEDRKLGRAIHCRLLEPEKYTTEFLVATPCCAKKAKDKQDCGNPGKKLWDGKWYCGVKGHAPAEATEPTDYIDESKANDIEALVSALQSHQVFTEGKLLRRAAWHEQTAVAEICGVMCKSRLDRVDTEFRTIVDLKKMQVGAGERETLEYSIKDYGWHRQAALYVMVVEALTGKTPEFVWLFVEDSEPFDIQVMVADEDDIEIGKFQVRQALTQYAAARKRNVFKGYIHDTKFIRRGALPDKYRQQFRDIGVIGGGTAAASENYADFGDAPAGEPSTLGPEECGDDGAVRDDAGGVVRV